MLNIRLTYFGYISNVSDSLVFGFCTNLVNLTFHDIDNPDSCIHKLQLLGYNKKDEINCVFDCNPLIQEALKGLLYFFKEFNMIG